MEHRFNLVGCLRLLSFVCFTLYICSIIFWVEGVWMHYIVWLPCTYVGSDFVCMQLPCIFVGSDFVWLACIFVGSDFVRLLYIFVGSGFVRLTCIFLGSDFVWLPFIFVGSDFVWLSFIFVGSDFEKKDDKKCQVDSEKLWANLKSWNQSR